MKNEALYVFIYTEYLNANEISSYLYVILGFPRTEAKNGLTMDTIQKTLQLYSFWS